MNQEAFVMLRPTLFVLAFATVAAAQQPAPALSRDEIAALAKLQAAINLVHDSINAQLALVRNKKNENQAALQEQMRTQVAELMHHSGVSDQDFRRKTYIVSTDPLSRKIYDSVSMAISGAPLPGTYIAPPGSAPGNTPVPPGVVGTHIGHVINGFSDTPNGQGLLTIAMAEARIAVQHAQLAGRQPTNLDYMKTHAGHVINALDPTIVAAGPGMKYGVKKAANGVVNHIELAAAATGASANVGTHTRHIATSARNTLKRVDDLIAIAQKVQMAASAAEAAALVSQMASLADQLIAGADANSDGRISWDVGEGGLQACDDHVKLMLAAEGRGGSK